MASPSEQVDTMLASDPRVYEHLELFTEAWSEADKSAAASRLLDAAHSGDARVPHVLWTVLDDAALQKALEGLFTTAPPSVQLAAAEVLSELGRDALAEPVIGLIQSGALRGHALGRACRLAASLAGSERLVDVVESSHDEGLKTALIDAIWQVEGLEDFPTVWFQGLGLVRRALRIPAPSFRDEAWLELKRLVGSSPDSLGYVPIQGASVPGSLQALIMDIFRGVGAPDPRLIDALDDDLRDAALVGAAYSLMQQGKARGARYVAELGGEAHRDVLEVAAGAADPRIAEAASAALAHLDAEVTA